ncbi:MAG TPA: NUDIX hydrolase [Microvirga sp.]|jgi:8-oxo-dGTP pyrophosphatase MutT (NUDIX family)
MASDRSDQRQVAALPFRVGADGRVEILLVTSRETGRWIVPKGWPMKGKTAFESAAQEAYEEAGVKGLIGDVPLGQYTYWKRKADHFLFCTVDVFALHVTAQLDTWREKGQRQSGWFSVEDAASRVLEPALGSIIQELPQHL